MKQVINKQTFIKGYKNFDENFCYKKCISLFKNLFFLTWNNVWWYEKGDPRNDDKKAGREVVGDDVVRHVSHQNHLESGQAK